MKKIFNKVDKKKLIILIICTILIIGFIVVFALVNKRTPKVEVKLNDNLSFEVNSEVNLLSLISEDNKVDIISSDEQIDTSKLGEDELVIKYKDRNKEKEYRFKINIIDTQAPVIEYQKELSTTAGTSIDLLKDVKASDNSKEDIKVSVEGEYNFDNVGTYTLKYVAVDSSGNKSEEEFTLKVNKKPAKINNNNKQTNNNQSNTNTNNTNNNTTTTNNTTNTSNYPTLAPYTIVPENEVYDALMNPNNNIKRTTFFWYISNVKKANGVVVEVNWDISCSSVKTIGAKDKAKAYMPPAPTGQQAIDLYNSNPNIHYGETILEVSY